VTESGQHPPGSRPAILAKDEADRRAALLSGLQHALAARGVRSVLARNHRLVLEGRSVKAAPSGPTDPQLHVFAPGGTRVVTASGRAFLLGGDRYPAGDPHEAVAAACRHAAPGRADGGVA